MAKREAESATIFIRDSMFCVDNMSGIGFLTSNEKSITINNSDNRPRDASCFNFRSFLNYLLPSPSVVTNQLSVALFDATFSEISDNLPNRMT